MSLFTQWVPHTWSDEPHQAELDAYADRVIDGYNELAPNFKQSVIHRQVIGPYEMEHDYGLDRRQHLPRRAHARAAVPHAARTRLRRLHDADRRAVPVLVGDARRRRRDGNSRAAVHPPHPAGPASGPVGPDEEGVSHAAHRHSRAACTRRPRPRPRPPRQRLHAPPRRVHVRSDARRGNASICSPPDGCARDASADLAAPGATARGAEWRTTRSCSSAATTVRCAASSTCAATAVTSCCRAARPRSGRRSTVRTTAGRTRSTARCARHRASTRRPASTPPSTASSPVRVEEWHGWAMVNVSGDAPPLARVDRRPRAARRAVRVRRARRRRVARVRRRPRTGSCRSRTTTSATTAPRSIRSCAP